MIVKIRTIVKQDATVGAFVKLVSGGSDPVPVFVCLFLFVFFESRLAISTERECHKLIGNISPIFKCWSKKAQHRRAGVLDISINARALMTLGISRRIWFRSSLLQIMKACCLNAGRQYHVVGSTTPRVSGQPEGVTELFQFVQKDCRFHWLILTLDTVNPDHLKTLITMRWDCLDLHTIKYSKLWSRLMIRICI